MQRSFNMRAAAIASLLLITGCTGTTSPTHRTIEPAGVTRSVPCPVAADAAIFEPAPLTADVRATGVQSCVVDLAARPGRGYWIRTSEKHAIAGGDEYVKALLLPPIPGATGPHGCFLTQAGPARLAVIDSAGALHYPKPPSQGCGVRSEVKAALAGLRWSSTHVRWITQLLPAGADPTCVPTWRVMDHGQQVPIAIGGTSNGTIAPNTAPAAVCYALPPQAPGPRPTDLIAARVVTDRATAAPMRAALSRRTGADGCKLPAWEAFRVYVGGTYVGYADLGPCLRYIPVGRATPAGLREALPTMSDPWETFNADDFTTFVPYDMYSSAYGLKALRKWRGYVARRLVGNPCRGLVDVSKCPPMRATAQNPVALTFTDTAGTGVSGQSMRRWVSGGLVYEQWSIALRCHRVIGVTASMLARDASALSAEVDDVVHSIAPTSRCR
jgi:hypothetical protein